MLWLPASVGGPALAWTAGPVVPQLLAPWDPLNFVEIKNPFGSHQTNPPADAWWVGLYLFLKEEKMFFGTPWGWAIFIVKICFRETPYCAQMILLGKSDSSLANLLIQGIQDFELPVLRIVWPDWINQVRSIQKAATGTFLHSDTTRKAVNYYLWDQNCNCIAPLEWLPSFSWNTALVASRAECFA